MGKERRRSPRVRQRAECEIELGKKTYPATLLDISEGGLAAVCMEELPVGLAGKISFRVMGKQVDVTALVWHCRQVRFRGQAAYAYGFMLEEASNSFHELLPREAGSVSRSSSSRPVPPTKTAAKNEEAPAKEATTRPAERTVSKDAIRAAQADGPKGKRLAHLRSELDDSLRQNRREASGTSFRVRAKMRTQPRTKTLTLSVTSEDEAREAVAKQLGPDWEILEVSAA